MTDVRAQWKQGELRVDSRARFGAEPWVSSESWSGEAELNKKARELQSEVFPTPQDRR